MGNVYYVIVFVSFHLIFCAHSVKVSQKDDRLMRQFKSSDAPQAFIHQKGNYFSISQKTLQLSGSTERHGSDSIGDYVAHSYQLATSADPQMIAVEIEEKKYSMTSDSLAEVTIYSQIFPNTITSTSTNDRNGLISGYPCLDYSQSTRSVGFWTLAGIHSGWMKQTFGLWTQENDMAKITDGLQSGPLILLDKEEMNTEIITRFSNFMTTHAVYGALGEKQVCWGIMGNVSQIPAGYSVSFIKVRLPGVLSGRLVFEKWGQIMTKFYGKTKAGMEDDLSVNYLGYYTDNGAYYYYLTEGKNITYEDTVYDVINHSYEEDIPYKYFQYDSWFYPKDNISNGVTQWVATEETFPKNLTWNYQRNMWPIVAHNRYFSAETVYAEQNGGSFKFVVEDKISVPVDQRFWRFLFQQSKLWGLVTYEQDWHNVILENSIATTSTLDIASDWLIHMGEAASELGLHIQYCMALPKSALQSLLINSVSHTRVSDDYQPGNDQWRIGLTSMFAWALNLAPFKDNFWSSTSQPGNPYGKEEPYPELHSVVSTLSGGPVAPADRIGCERKDLIMKSVNQNGLILRADRPALAIDKQLQQMTSLINDGPSGEVWTTHSTIGPYVHGIIFSVLNKSSDSYEMYVQELGFDIAQWSLLFAKTVNSNILVLHGFLDGLSGKIKLENCTKTDFCLIYTSPIIPLFDESGKMYAVISFLGETGKWVPISPNRISGIEKKTEEIWVSISGAPFEEVTMVFMYLTFNASSIDQKEVPTPGVYYVGCALDNSGHLIMTYPGMNCIKPAGGKSESVIKIENITNPEFLQFPTEMNTDYL